MKKAQVDPMKVIMLAVILIIVVIVILSIFTNLFGKQAKGLSDTIDRLQDYDNDGKADFLDSCPCDPINAEGCFKKITCKAKDDCSCSK